VQGSNRWPADEESKSHKHANALITLWFPRFLRKCTSFSDSIESIDSMNSISCDIFYHKSITPLPISYLFYKSHRIENLCVLDMVRLDEFFDHTGSSLKETPHFFRCF
jgi:hypothetical protein